MKKIWQLIGCALLFFNTINAQQIAYYDGDDIIIKGNSKSSSNKLTEGITIDESKLFKADVLVYYSEDISKQISIPEKSVFYVGLQSPYDSTIWIYLERDRVGTKYRLWKYNTASNSQELLYENTDGTGSQLQYVPIAWSKKQNIIYVEAKGHFDTEEKHKGIYSYDLKNKNYTKLSIFKNYLTTPILSPDRSSFAYNTASSEEEVVDIVHDEAQKIQVYDLNTNTEKVIAVRKGATFGFMGWVTDDVNYKQLLISEEVKQLATEKTTKESQKAAVTFKLPWVAGKPYCVSRHGTPEPTGPVGGVRCDHTYSGVHGYAAIDFDTPNDASDEVLASAAGTVSMAVSNQSGAISGYGNYVLIRHADNSQTRYAHLSRVYVSVGDCVGQGNVIGLEGTTGGSTGDHQHFEKIVGGNEVNVVFEECNCTPRQNRSYTSENRKTTGCGGPSCDANLTLSGTINGGTYKASNRITASGTVSSGNSVTLDAKTDIFLNTGFFVTSSNNAVFVAKVGTGCVASSKIVGDEATIIENSDEEMLQVYPNPSTDVFNIEYNLKNANIISLVLYDFNGRIVVEKKLGKQNIGVYKETLAISNLPTGIYLLKLNSGESVITKKLVIGH